MRSIEAECLEELSFFEKERCDMHCTHIWSIITGNDTIKVWDITCATLEQRPAARRAMSAAVIGLAVCGGTSIVRPRDAQKGPLHEERTVFRWLKTCLMKCAHRYQEQRFERLLTENRRLKAQLLELNDGQPITLSPEQKRRLAAKRQALDPRVLQALDAIDLEGTE
jgi:hypothetical protein